MANKPTKKRALRPTELVSGMQRLNRVLAASGLGSRRDVEQLIIDGRVEVDGQTVTDLAFRVDPKASSIEVDGTALRKHRPVYFALNKPTGVLSTNHDPSGRTRVVDLVPSRDRIFPVGRLDRSSEGLMLLTNDGELAQRLAHPRYGVQKTYFVVVQGVITHEELAKLKKGVYLADGVARIDGAKIRRQRKTCTEIEIILSEGKNREIRRILARVGHKVVVLRRLAIGPLRLAQLPVGQTRQLTSSEVEALYRATTIAKENATATKPRPSGTKPRKKPIGRATTLQATPLRAAPMRAETVRRRTGSLLPGFSGTATTGAVLSYDETPAEKTPSHIIRPRKKKSAAPSRSAQNPQSQGSSGKSTSGGRSKSSASTKRIRNPKAGGNSSRRRGGK